MKESGSLAKQNRNPSIELLRSVAMLMIITMHYLDKGKVTIPLDLPQNLYSVLFWFIHSFCIVAVNCYVLISGYFMLDSKFKWEKLVRLVLQILFYSVLVPIFMVAIGLLDVGEINLYKMILYFLPIQTKHYWFATSYVLLYIFSPVLVAGAKNLTKEQLKTTILIGLIVLSVAKTILPFQMELDEYGYSFVWFALLFLVAAYIRLYGIEYIKTPQKGLLVYSIGSICTFCLAFAIRALSLKLDKFGYFVTRTFDYNHLLCFVSSVGLFLCFLYMNMKDGPLKKMALWTGPYTFGVYLLHEQWEMRHVWPKLLNTEKYAGTAMGIIHWLLSIVIVFAVGVLVDCLRDKIFRLIANIISKKRVTES